MTTLQHCMDYDTSLIGVQHVGESNHFCLQYTSLITNQSPDSYLSLSLSCPGWRTVTDLSVSVLTVTNGCLCQVSGLCTNAPGCIHACKTLARTSKQYLSLTACCIHTSPCSGCNYIVIAWTTCSSGPTQLQIGPDTDRDS